MASVPALILGRTSSKEAVGTVQHRHFNILYQNKSMLAPLVKDTAKKAHAYTSPHQAESPCASILNFILFKISV